jgi:hypothetical protein
VNFVQVFLRERFLTEGGFGFDAPSSLSPEGALAFASTWASVTWTPSFAAAARIDA